MLPQGLRFFGDRGGRGGWQSVLFAKQDNARPPVRGERERGWREDENECKRAELDGGGTCRGL